VRGLAHHAPPHKSGALRRDFKLRAGADPGQQRDAEHLRRLHTPAAITTYASCVGGLPAKEDDMLTTRRCASVMLMIALVAATVIGCASTGTTTPVAVKDFSGLAGKWTGWIRTTGSGSIPATFELTPGGDYVTRTEGFNTVGKAQVKDGALVLVGTGGTGRLGVSGRTSTAWITERTGGMLVMTGSGRDDIGPFDFEFTKQK
jgi:hypothetical protein